MLSGDLLNLFLPRDLADLVCSYLEGVELAAVARADYWPAVLSAQLRALLARMHPRVDPGALFALLQETGAVISGSVLLAVLCPPEAQTGTRALESGTSTVSKKAAQPSSESDAELADEKARETPWPADSASAVMRGNGVGDLDIFASAPAAEKLAIFFGRLGYVAEDMPMTNRNAEINYTGPIAQVTWYHQFANSAAEPFQVITVADPVRHVEDNFDFRALRNWADGARFHIGHPREVAARTIRTAEVLA